MTAEKIELRTSLKGPKMQHNAHVIDYLVVQMMLACPRAFDYLRRS